MYILKNNKTRSKKKKGERKKGRVLSTTHLRLDERGASN